MAQNKRPLCSLGLDVSTTCLGICLIENQTNAVVYAKALSLAKYDHRNKKQPVEQEFLRIANEFNVTRVFIEAPLFLRGKTSANTITKLFHFNGWVSCFSYMIFNAYPEYVDLNKARRKFGVHVPGKEKTKENTSKKKVLDFLVSLGYNLTEERTRSGNVKESSYDISDAAFALYVGRCSDAEDCRVDI